jgi:predicted site-specific integrase-resolvase
MQGICEIGTIRAIHQRLLSEGIQISEYALRIWVKQGKLPAVYTGNKALISYNNVRKLLDGELSA